MKALLWLFYLPLLVAVAGFGAANRHAVDISFDPLPFGLTAPVFAVVLGSVLIGLLVGGVSAWTSGRTWRQTTRRMRRNNALLETEVGTLREQLEAAAAQTPELPANLHGAQPLQRVQGRTVSAGELVS